MINVVGCDHIGVRTDDMAASIAFYEKLGGTVYKTDKSGTTDLAMVNLAGAVNIELIAPAEITLNRGGVQTIPHIAIEVTQIDEVIADLRAKGVAFLTEQTIDHPKLLGGIRIIFIAGPNGEEIELLEHIG